MKALVIVDMQNDFISGALGTAQAQVIVPDVIKKIDAWEGDIFVTQDTHSADYMDTQEGRKLPVIHCVEGTPGWEVEAGIRAALDRKVAAGASVTYFTKPTFGSRVLAEHLAALEMPVEEIELVGLCTDICVISNAMLLKAFLPEVPIRVDASCCAGVTAESHANALAAMGGCQIEIVNQ